MNASQRRVSDALDALTVAVEDEALPTGVVWSLGYLRAWMEERIVSERTEAAAKKLRSWSQIAGISNWQPWEDIGENRQRQWLRLARAVSDEGMVFVAADDLRAVLHTLHHDEDRGLAEAAAERLREVLGE